MHVVWEGHKVVIRWLLCIHSTSSACPQERSLAPAMASSYLHTALLVGLYLSGARAFMTTGARIGQWQTATPTSSQRGLRNEATTTLSMAATDTRDSSNPVRVAILGASGYTGAELVRLLLSHSGVEIAVLTGNTQAGKPFSDVYPQFSYAKNLPALTQHEDHDWKDVDCVFCCLPHATTQEIIMQLPEHLKIVDLSADFRLKDIETYAKWYGGEHKAPALQAEAVYGLTELARDEVRNARLVANPGCYPTAAQLPLIALIKAGLILTEDIIIDAKSGTTGAGRAPKQGTLYCEVADGINAYGVGSHRHAPEIEQGLGEACGANVVVNFTPHLMPMSRGILETIYVKLSDGSTVEDAKAALEKAYDGERFVTVLPGAAVPHTRHVRGSNHVFMNVVPDRLPGRAIVLVSMDNLVKGASGQAIQNMNVMFGLPETQGVDMAPMFP